MAEGLRGFQGFAGHAASMPWDIAVQAAPSMDGWLAEVTLRDGGRSHGYKVRVSEDAWRRLTGARVPVEALLEASFEFLLAREPPEAILRVFEVNVIPRYFPEYEHEMRQRFA